MQKELTILIVDDELAQHVILEKLLKFRIPQVKCLHAYSGAEAIKILQENYRQINILISDIEMPLVSGFEVVEFLRKDLKSNMLTIAHTSYPHDRHLFKKVGFDRYIEKSTNLVELQNILEEEEFDKLMDISYVKVY